MAKRDEKKEMMIAALDALETPSGSQRSMSAKRIRKIHPLGFRIVVRLQRDSNVTDAGLYLPEGAKQSMMESVVAEVIEVASAMDDRTDEETNVSGIPLGAHVLIPKNAGIKVPWDDDVRVVETKDVLALIDEINII